MNPMPSGETNKDAPSVITGLAPTMGFNECEQIADMMEIVENQSLSEHICFASTWSIVIASFEMMNRVFNKFRKIHADQGDGLSELGCLGCLGLEVHTVEP